MELIVKKSQAICPTCSGLVTRMSQGDYYRCIDCCSIYKGQAAGYVEGGIIVDKIKEAEYGEDYKHSDNRTCGRK